MDFQTMVQTSWVQQFSFYIRKDDVFVAIILSVSTIIERSCMQIFGMF